MRKQNVFLSIALIALALMISVSSCKKSEETTVFGISSMKAGDVDINGATPPNTVPANAASIVISFNLEVNKATATVDKFSLIRSYDGASMNFTIGVSGGTITLTLSQGLGNGAQYTLNVKSGIGATDGQIVGAFNRSFTTVGNFVPDGMFAYWNFDNNVNDQIGTYNGTPTDLTYAASYKTSAGQAGEFNGTTTLVQVSNGDQLDNTADFTLSFWIKADSSKHGQFCMGLAGWYGFQFEIAGDYKSCKLAAQYEFANGLSGSEDLWFPADGNLGWQGWTFCRDLTGAGGLPFLLADKWAHVVCKYNASTKVGTMYINGDKMKEQDFNLWPAGDPKTTVVGLVYAGNALNNTFVFGFIQDRVDPTINEAWALYDDPANNHFKGLLDDVRIFHKALTEQEIQLMYASEKP